MLDSAPGRARSYRDEAITLKSMPLGEADLLVTLYTRDWGKVRAVAKGARRSNSRLVGHLEPLTLTRLTLSRGRSLDMVNQAQVLKSFAPLKSDLTAVTKGLYVAELIDGFGSEGQPNQSLFRLALDTLEAIGRDPESELVLHFYRLHLLASTGFMVELYHCVECRQPLEPGQHRFSPNGGGALCSNCTPSDVQLRPLSLRALKVLRLLDRRSIHELPKLELKGALAQEIKSILGAAVEYWLDKEIRSNSFLEHLQRS